MPAFRRWLSFLLLPVLTAVGAGEPVVVPRFTHPGAGQTFYFVLTDRFANGRGDNDAGGLEGGPAVTGFDPTRISHYHGGDFAGLTARLDYLQRLGVTAVWVTPPFRNKPMQAGTAGYHGYWITDFLAIDSHLGTDAEFREFIRQAHARGMRVYMDIIVNHTADVIQLENRSYRPRTEFPVRDAQGRAFDERAVAWNGLTDPAAYPALSPEKSFAYPPHVPAAEREVKRPAWLNDVTVYHNRGDSTFAGESATLGDFAALDDLATEDPRVVRGFIDIFQRWLDYGIDGYRIDTTRHVNNEFWQAFAPAIRARARELGRPDFLQFGEVYNDAGDAALLSGFSTHTPLDATLDFGFFAAVKKFAGPGGRAADLAAFFARDDWYTDHDSNVHSTTTFLGNHDAGRFAWFLKRDDPGATPAQLAELVRLGHGLMFFARGQPVIYYGDEQGMIGRGGGDMQAREDMFAARAPDFANAALLATTRIGRDDKFDESHPFYRLIARLGQLRTRHPALRTGAMLVRPTDDDHVFAFSRFDRGELVEYVAVFNQSRTATLSLAVPTSQPAGARLQRIFDSSDLETAAIPVTKTDDNGRLPVTVAPLQFLLWRAEQPLAAAPTASVTIAAPVAQETLVFTAHENDGLVFPSRCEVRAEVAGGDGVGEVTFTLTRSSRPDQIEYLGTDDAAPNRIFWSPPADLAPGETLAFTATHDDLRGHRASANVAGVKIRAEGHVPFGITGAAVPRITRQPAATRSASRITLVATAEGTAPLEYQWLRDGAEIPGANEASLELEPASAGEYRVLVRNLAGTTISASLRVESVPAAGAAGR